MKYLAYPWPDYQDYMEKEWFREECYYDSDKDTYLIPENRVMELCEQEYFDFVHSEKLKYKVGDTVTIKSEGWYNRNCDGLGDVPLKEDIYFASEMSKYCGMTATIMEIQIDCYMLDIDKGRWLWTDEMFE